MSKKTELVDYSTWMGAGAREVSKHDDGSVTLALDGEQRTFFKKAPPISKAAALKAGQELETELKAHLAKAGVAWLRAGEQLPAKKEATMVKKAELTNSDFGMIVKAVQLRHGCSPRDARVAVSLAMRDGTLGKQLSGQEIATIAKLNTAAKAQEGGADFEQLIVGIRKAKGGSRAEAIRQARRANPDAFASWQGA
jgi:hypothetical protein